MIISSGKVWLYLVDDTLLLRSAHEGQRRFKVVHQLFEIPTLQQHIFVVGKQCNTDPEDHRHAA